MHTHTDTHTHTHGADPQKSSALPRREWYRTKKHICYLSIPLAEQYIVHTFCQIYLTLQKMLMKLWKKNVIYFLLWKVISLQPNIYIYIYIYVCMYVCMCECLCVCVCEKQTIHYISSFTIHHNPVHVTHLRRFSWAYLITCLYRPSLQEGLQGYILYRHRAVAYRF